jgi:hypothetical protein
MVASPMHGEQQWRAVVAAGARLLRGELTTATVRGTPSTDPSTPYFGVKTIWLTQ